MVVPLAQLLVVEDSDVVVVWHAEAAGAHPLDPLAELHVAEVRRVDLDHDCLLELFDAAAEEFYECRKSHRARSSCGRGRAC